MGEDAARVRVMGEASGCGGVVMRESRTRREAKTASLQMVLFSSVAYTVYRTIYLQPAVRSTIRIKGLDRRTNMSQLSWYTGWTKKKTPMVNQRLLWCGAAHASCTQPSRRLPKGKSYPLLSCRTFDVCKLLTRSPAPAPADMMTEGPIPPCSDITIWRLGNLGRNPAPSAPPNSSFFFPRQTRTTTRCRAVQHASSFLPDSHRTTHERRGSP